MIEAMIKAMIKDREDFISGKCQTIYGPVQSKRFGRSLGINLGDSNEKICSWGCVYCQFGMGSRADRVLGVPEVPSLIEALKTALQAHPDIQAVTIAGNTEPTGYPWFFELATQINRLANLWRGHSYSHSKSQSKWKSIVLTNAYGMLDQKNVDACALFDEVWCKLDCATADLFTRLNRPYQLDLAGHFERLKRVPNLRIQTLVWTAEDARDRMSCEATAKQHATPVKNASLSNWTPENQEALIKAYIELKPVAVDLTTVSRATALAGLKPVARQELKDFQARLIKLGIEAAIY